MAQYATTALERGYDLSKAIDECKYDQCYDCLVCKNEGVKEVVSTSALGALMLHMHLNVSKNTKLHDDVDLEKLYEMFGLREELTIPVMMPYYSHKSSCLVIDGYQSITQILTILNDDAEWTFKEIAYFIREIAVRGYFKAVEEDGGKHVLRSHD